MTGEVGSESGLDRDPDIEVDLSAEAEDENFAAHLKDLENGAGRTGV